jgi:3-oxosteroid 1-dehydrogenase
MATLSLDDFDKLVDVVIVGSGAGGLASALAAQDAGLDTLVIEKTDFYGGSTARSGGGAWVPNAPALLRKGERDDPAEILRYLQNIAGDKVPRERLARYVEEAPRLMEFLESQSEWLRDGFFWIEGYSDYHPDKGCWDPTRSTCAQASSACSFPSAPGSHRSTSMTYSPCAGAAWATRRSSLSWPGAWPGRA